MAESLDYILAQRDRGRVVRLLEALRAHARLRGVGVPFSATTPYINTIPADESPIPGDRGLERRIKSIVRWNAMAMVVRANRESDGIGGHISTFASLATLFEVGLTTSSAARTATAAATSFISRVTPRPACTRALSSKAG